MEKGAGDGDKLCTQKKTGPTFRNGSNAANFGGYNRSTLPQTRSLPSTKVEVGSGIGQGGIKDPEGTKKPLDINKSSSSVPTDLTISDISHSSDLNSGMIFPKSRKNFRETFCDVGLKQDRKGHALETAAQERRQLTSVKKADENVKKMSRLRADFDNLPSAKQTMNQIKREMSENRFQSHKKICELNAEVMVKSKESEFFELQLARSYTDLRDVKSELASKDAEIKELRKTIEYQEDKYNKQILELTLELQSKNAKLEGFEKLYSDMDHLANVDTVSPVPYSKSGNVHSMFPMGSAVPTTFRYKLQQSMDLTQRLKEERDHLERCRDEADRKQREAETKYQSVLIELNKLKIGEDMKLNNLKSALQMKAFELERVSLLLEDYQQKVTILNNENQELRTESKITNTEHHESTLELNKEVTRLSLELESKSSKLDLYENIENALDEMIVRAAAVPDKDIGKRLLSFCSSGPSLPTDARRRLQQAFDLAKKNCELQKAVAEQRAEILDLYDERQVLRQENDIIRSLNGYSVSQLIDAVCKKNREIGKLTKQLESVEREIIEMKHSKEVLEQIIHNLKEYNEQMLTLYHSGAQAQQVKLDRGVISPGREDELSDDELVKSQSSFHLRNNSETEYSGDGTLSVIPSLKTSREGRSTVSYTFGDSVLPVTKSGRGGAWRVLKPNEKKSDLGTISEERKKPLEYDFDDSSITLESPSSVSSSMFGPPPVVVGPTTSRVYTPGMFGPMSSPGPLSSPPVYNKAGRHLYSYEVLALKNRDRDRPVPLRLSKVKPKRRSKSTAQF